MYKTNIKNKQRDELLRLMTELDFKGDTESFITGYMTAKDSIPDEAPVIKNFADIEKEFKEKFVDCVCPIDLAIDGDAVELWSWFESKLKSEIAETCKKAKIEENQYWQRHHQTKYGYYSLLENRIKELNAPLGEQQ